MAMQEEQRLLASPRELPRVLRVALAVRVRRAERMARAAEDFLPRGFAVPRVSVVSSRALGVAAFQFVAAHAEVDVHARRHCEAEGSADALQVDLLHIENILVRVRRVAQQVGAEGVLRTVVQIEVLLNQHRHLRTDLRHLMRRELILLQLHFGVLQVLQELQLLGKQEQQRTALRVSAAGCAADAVDVLLRVVRRVVLHDPIHRGDVQPTRGDVGAEEDALRLFAELEEGGGALLLLLLAVDVHHLDVDVVQQLRMKLYGVARRKEHLRHMTHDVI